MREVSMSIRIWDVILAYCRFSTRSGFLSISSHGLDWDRLATNLATKVRSQGRQS